MIKKGMEVGAVFEDGGSHYIVEAICGDNYISRRVDSTIESTEITSETSTETVDQEVKTELKENSNEPKAPETKKPVARITGTKKAPVKRTGNQKR